MRTLFMLFFFAVLSVVFHDNAFAQTDAMLPNEAEGEAVVEQDILPADAVFLGEGEDNGVRALAYLYKAPAAPTGAATEKTLPYLLFVRFIHSESNVKVEKGLVAYKVEDQDDGYRRAATKMELKNGYFVASLNVERLRGKNLLIGSKLEDDKKRQYSYVLRTR